MLCVCVGVYGCYGVIAGRSQNSATTSSNRRASITPSFTHKTHTTTAMPSIQQPGLLLLVLLVVVQGFVPAPKVPTIQVSKHTGLDLGVQFTPKGNSAHALSTKDGGALHGRRVCMLC